MRANPLPQSFENLVPRIVGHGGAIILGPKGSWTVVAHDIQDYAREEGKKLRAPHHSVSGDGLRDEVGKAGSGVLLLDEIDNFSDAALLELETALHEAATAGRPSPTVIALLYLRKDPDDAWRQARAERLASIYKLPLLVLDDAGMVTHVLQEPVLQEVPYPARLDLELINAHRHALGMPALDPEAAGWRPEDVQIEAERIRMLTNPELDMGEVKTLLPGEVPVKAGSHRAWDKVVRELGYRPQTYYSFQRKSSAGTSFFFLPKGDYLRVAKFKGVAKWRMRPGERWAKTIRFGRGDNPDVKWGKPYGLPYRRPDGSIVWMYRGKQNRVRFYDKDGKQVGPEQKNVAPAVAAAITQGWVQLDQLLANPEWVDRLPGGLADKYTPADFDPVALAEGTRVELEHTADRRLATEIAMDHLVEDPKYYEKLRTIHHNPDSVAAIKARLLAY
jgi:hypothetical protein